MAEKPGVAIKPDGSTDIPNLYVAGEVAGGVHGRNQLMGNSLLEITVYGRRAGKAAALRAREVELGQLTLDHLRDWERQLKEANLEPPDSLPLPPARLHAPYSTGGEGYLTPRRKVEEASVLLALASSIWLPPVSTSQDDDLPLTRKEGEDILGDKTVAAGARRGEWKKKAHSNISLGSRTSP